MQTRQKLPKPSIVSKGNNLFLILLSRGGKYSIFRSINLGTWGSRILFAPSGKFAFVQFQSLNGGYFPCQTFHHESGESEPMGRAGGATSRK